MKCRVFTKKIAFFYGSVPFKRSGQIQYKIMMFYLGHYVLWWK